MKFPSLLPSEEIDLNIVENFSLSCNNSQSYNNISAAAADLSWYRHNFYAGAARVSYSSYDKNWCAATASHLVYAVWSVQL